MPLRIGRSAAAAFGARLKRGIFLSAVAAAVLVHAPLHSKESTTPPAHSTRGKESPVRTAPVLLGGKAVVSVPSIHAFSAQERAARISRRVTEIADNESIPAASIASSDGEEWTDVVAGDQVLMSFSDSDAAALGRTRQELGGESAAKLRAAVEEYRRSRAPSNIWHGVVLSIVATAALLFAFLLLKLVGRKLRAAVEKRKELSVRFHRFEILRSEQVRAVLNGSIRGLGLVIVLVICYLYVHFSLGFFPWTRPLSGQLLHYIMVPLRTMELGFFDYIPNLIFLVILVAVTHYVLKFMRLFAQEVENGYITFSGFYREWAKPTYKIARFAVIAFVAVVAFPYLPGSQSPAFKGISIFLGVLISLGSSSTVSNIIAGLDLTYRRAFLKGDYVKIGEYTGQVTRMRLLVTHLLSFKNEEIILPNAVILNSQVVNYSSTAREGALILHVSVTIGYATPWRQIHAFLLQAAERTPGLLHQPPPFVLQTALDDFYVRYELNAYTTCPQEMPNIYSNLYLNIQDAFNEYGVQIMSPHYMLDPRSPAVVPKERWYEPPATPPEGGTEKKDETA